MLEFKLDKANQKQLWDILNGLLMHEDLDDYGSTMIYEAAEAIQSLIAQEPNPKDFWSIVHYQTVQGEVEIDIDE